VTHTFLHLPRPPKSPTISAFTGNRKIRALFVCLVLIVHSIMLQWVISAVAPQALTSHREPNMIRGMEFASDQEMTAETHMWRAVIARTIHEWLSKPLRPKLEAERYLFANSPDLSLVCRSAGIDIGRLRTCLNKVRGRTLLDLLPIAA
jgi:hypothetical protein